MASLVVVSMLSVLLPSLIFTLSFTDAMRSAALPKRPRPFLGSRPSGLRGLLGDLGAAGSALGGMPESRGATGAETTSQQGGQRGRFDEGRAYDPSRAL